MYSLDVQIHKLVITIQMRLVTMALAVFQMVVPIQQLVSITKQRLATIILVNMESSIVLILVMYTMVVRTL